MNLFNKFYSETNPKNLNKEKVIEFISETKNHALNVVHNNEELNYTFTFETIINHSDNYFNPFKPTILLGWVNNNHYVLLMTKNLNIELTPLEYRNKIYNIFENI